MKNRKSKKVKKVKKKSTWTGIFKDVKYSNGPSDNIYVYG